MQSVPAIPEQNCSAPSLPFAAEVFAGPSLHAQRLRLQVDRMSPHYRTLLIIGECGSGKATVARTVHARSAAAGAACDSLSCTEFAQQEAAVGGPGFYLSELEALRVADQAAFLDRLNRLRRDCRVMVGCQCDPRGLVASGRLSQEIYSRIATLEIRVPPLRERLEDLPAMLAQLGFPACPADEHDRLKAHGWPVNLKELHGFCAHARQAGAPDWSRLVQQTAVAYPETMRLDEVIERHVLEVLERCAGNKLKAAELLGISRSTLYRMLDAPAG